MSEKFEFFNFPCLNGFQNVVNYKIQIMAN